ncbi:hypothetical protein C1H46_045221 [Malus baccata]|uniref:Uncharacterized protein n=1 Tax=Malus baccata TaxID=106549 RepID=A0A540K4T3_MALBA|nr:hypothetical protein C1H46_045221 [Malus baccata]
MSGEIEEPVGFSCQLLRGKLTSKLNSRRRVFPNQIYSSAIAVQIIKSVKTMSWRVMRTEKNLKTEMKIIVALILMRPRRVQSTTETLK